MVGTTLGVYRIDVEIGRGGMGQVYRAHDTILNRTVAIKVLPDGLASDPDRLARFEREAQALAALNHPNIAHIYGLEKSGPTPAIVMEFVGGEDLSARIRRGPVPLAEALPLALQIADALAAAHEAGIIHRDLKPANIKVTDDGTVKVLDFGLAKALDPSTTPGTSEAANSPTLTNRATQMGVILGTAAYMAPEQARGKAVDKRADIWAFGVVLYEMLTGRRPFDGDDVTDVLAAVVRAEPDWTALPKSTPPLIRRLLQRCLMKDAKQRLHDIADARLEIEESTGVKGQEDANAARPGGWPKWVVLTVVLSALAIGLAAGFVLFGAAPDVVPVTFATLDVAPAEEMSTWAPSNVRTQRLAGGPRTALAWSPDGRSIAFVGLLKGVRQIFIRDLGEPTARPLEGTDGANALALSPDGQWIAFFASGELRRVRVEGGPAAKVCACAAENGISWGATRIVFAGSSMLYEVAPAGGEPRQLTSPPTGTRHASPHLLPGDGAVLFTEHDKNWTSGDERVMVLRLGAPGAALASPARLLSEGADARYQATGHLAFMRQGTLFVVPFDLRTLELRGDQIPAQRDVAQAVIASSAENLTLAAQFAVSAQGSLAYVVSSLASFPESEIVAVDRAGRVTPVGTPPGRNYTKVSVWRDDAPMAVVVRSAKKYGLSLFDLRRKNLAPATVPIDGELVFPNWSKDGRLVAGLSQAGVMHGAVFRPDSSSPPEILADSDGFWPSAWSPDDRLIIGRRGNDLWVYPVGDASTKPKAFFETTSASETNPMWSPDGRWVVYVSNASGNWEVYVRPYPGPEPAIKVSEQGGTLPAWNPAGRELFYVQPGRAAGENRTMMVVDMTDPTRPGRPTPLFSFSNELTFSGTPSNWHDVAPDGRRFYVARTLRYESPPVTHINVTFNWFEELKKAGQKAR